MSHREEPEEAGLRGPPPHRSKQANGTPLEGGRPRWRPCQLHNPDAEGQGHHHHHHQHYHHQANQHPSGSSRAAPRHRRRHVPGQAQRRRAESGDTEARAGQQPKAGASRHHRSGERLHQHRYRQQHKAEEEEVVKTPPKKQAPEPLSPEDSSQELLTPSPQDEPITDSLDGNSPDVSHSSDTQVDRDLESSREQLEDIVQSEESTLGEEELTKEEYFKETPEQDYAPPKTASKSRPESKRTSPLRVDVPPFVTSPHHMINKPFFQSPRSFPETLRSYNSDPNSYPPLFNVGYSHTNKDKGFESPMSHQEDLSDSSPEACSDSYPQLSPEETQRESYLTDPHPALEGPQVFESVTTDECDPQEDIGLLRSVGSRLHHYDEQSGDEAESSGRVRAQVRKTSSSTSLSQEAPPREEAPETAQLSPEAVERPDTSSAPAQDQITEYCRDAGDAVSLAIKDIKEAIEEVKTKTVRSPYTPDKITEPVWVMRQDLSPVEESHPQPQPQSACQLSLTSPQYAVSELSAVITVIPYVNVAFVFLQLSKIIDRKSCHINECVSSVQSPGSGSTSPQGAESSSRHLPSHEGSDSFESPSPASKESRRSLASFPTYVEVPGPCDPEDLIDGIIFAANYLGSTQLLSDKTPSKNVRMMQAQEAVSRIKTAQKLAKNRKKAPEGEAQPMTEVDLFISTQRIKVLNADSQETMMDHPLRTISYIADIGNIVVLMARRRMPRSDSQENMEASDPAQDEKRQYKMICHVFESEDAQLIAQSIGQAFSVAYQEFLRANGINPEDLSQKEYSDLLNTQDMYNDDLIHFSKSENCKDVYIEKQKGEILGVVIVESGWGSILPTVIIANMMHGGPAEKSGRLNIGDQIMSINGTSLVGLPLSTCQSIIKGLKNQSRIKLNIVRCPPVTTVLIRRPDLRYQLGFSVQNGIVGGTKSCRLSVVYIERNPLVSSGEAVSPTEY
ncbi:amyloid-beta A4 precursor protein-binding family A member 1-like [Puntigrus tetrazona]|uniref:amyloid-beta A4 precursor protein-binding family A member 1-like n=1 Tax=Puntigrus tetrazona TaxID=1606681 RepID=UPI001C8A942E|nr:amyloid-beta A4 precursor protein-binding family A member 1-like [Puntigrus tetrazona]